MMFEELAAGCTSTAAYLSIHNMVVVDDRPLRRRGAAPALAARSVRDGAARQLLPDRARRRLRRGLPAHHARGARATALCAGRQQGVHLRRRASAISISSCAAPAARGRRASARCWSRRARRASRFGKPGEEDGLALAADGHGRVRRLPRARSPTGIGAEGDGLQDRHARAGRRAGQHRRLLAGGGARLPRARPRPTSRSGASSAAGWPTSRHCSSGSPTWRPSSRRRG